MDLARPARTHLPPVEGRGERRGSGGEGRPLAIPGGNDVLHRKAEGKEDAAKLRTARPCRALPGKWHWRWPLLLPESCPRAPRRREPFLDSSLPCHYCRLAGSERKEEAAGLKTDYLWRQAARAVGRPATRPCSAGWPTRGRRGGQRPRAEQGPRKPPRRRRTSCFRAARAARPTPPPLSRHGPQMPERGTARSGAGGGTGNGRRAAGPARCR